MRTITYLGWHGRGNLGDDAIRDAVELGLEVDRIVDLPLYPREIVGQLATGLRTRTRDTTLVVGGGTCIGRRNWRRHLQLGLVVTKRRPPLIIGAGVEDPAFFGRNSYSDRGELARWSRLLLGSGKVTVRGPRSAELLADIGIEAAVVGDPALLFEPADQRRTEGLVGVNIGFGDDLWGHDPSLVTSAGAEMCATLERRGHRFVGISMNREDDLRLREMFGRASIEAAVVTPTTVEQLLDLVGSCALVVASRLHASVFSAIAGTPTLILEYQPKCRDFAESVHLGDWCFRTDNLSGGRLASAALAALGQADEMSMQLRSSVAELRGRLVREYAEGRIRLAAA